MPSVRPDHQPNTMYFRQSSTPKDPGRGLALQKYLLLHSEHDALQKHLNHISLSVSTGPESNHCRHSSISTSLSSSPSDDNYLSTPTSFRHQRCGSLPQSQRPTLKTRRSSLPVIIDENLMCEIAEDESRIKRVNQQIKGTLTDLLNCESVRADGRYRMWIQTRLMDAEKELKGNRVRSCEKRRMSEDVSF